MLAKSRQEELMGSESTIHIQMFCYWLFLGLRDQHRVFWPGYKISPRELMDGLSAKRMHENKNGVVVHGAHS